MSANAAPSTRLSSTLDVCCDVGKDELHLNVASTPSSPFPRVFAIANRTEAIRKTLAEIAAIGTTAGLERVRVVVEPTGVYHKLLLRLARERGFETALVNAEHVVKMRQVIFGDSGKTDRRDPIAIAGVVATGRTIPDRTRPEVYDLLSGWAKLYQDAEDGMVEAKNRVHTTLQLLFPDFDFSTDFLYSASGRAILAAFGCNPHRIAPLAPSRIAERLRRSCNIRRSSIERLLHQARASASSTPAGARSDLLEETLRVAFEDLELHERRREAARAQLDALYAEARREDPRLPAAVKGVVSTTMLARIVAETGPLSNFDSWRQLHRLAGLNLRERQSGKWRGLTKISRKGRAGLRRLLNVMVLPLVRRGELFGDWYQHKTGTQKMPGKKAMTAVSRKAAKMLWGWYQSGGVFDATRVTRCESQHRLVA